MMQDISSKDLNIFFDSDKANNNKKQKKETEKKEEDVLKKVTKIISLKGEERKKQQEKLSKEELEILEMVEKNNRSRKKTKTTDRARRLYVYNKDIKWLALVAISFVLVGFFLAVTIYPTSLTDDVKAKIKRGWGDIFLSMLTTLVFTIAGGISSFYKLKCKPGSIARFLQDKAEKKKNEEESKKIDPFGRTVEVYKK